ncbi:DNA replication terminus site-binding protein [Paraglaciecola chathamensis]|uniref:DNA replication terminus site-binding protein n=1 Tax=Paraglaciecola agarilytica NO2 TaxID=1125747 RepID=A0ABQ0I276_9ALTE|nr:DNA replication terminus site-binding protein [Paraglaciecola agarilytica]GAC03423.1 DNA replication terminus site-binding protein [Paraglaciecola agarilytica NO2]
MANLIDLMSALEAEIVELRILIREMAIPELCTYFHVPLVTKDDENSIIEFGYSNIEVTTLTGHEALQRSLEAFSDFYVPDSSFSRRFVTKHPGLIVVSGAKAEISEQVKRVNAAKLAFKSGVLALSDAALEKWKEVHDRFMHLITTTVYRSIYCFDENVHRINFNWVSRPRVSNLTKNELVEKIESGMFTIPPSHSMQSWKAVLDADKSLIEKQRNETFTIRRRIKLRPEASIRLEDANTAIGYSAGLPYIAFNKPSYFTPLETFDASTKQNRSRKEDSLQLLIKRMNLYADRNSSRA